MSNGVDPNDDYDYDIYLTLNRDRETNLYQANLFLDSDGKVYFQEFLYPDEKIEIVVREWGFGETLERFDVLPYSSRIGLLPDEITSLFTIAK